MATNSINRTLPDSGSVEFRVYVHKDQELRAKRLINGIPSIYKNAFKNASNDFGKKLLNIIKTSLTIGQPPKGSGISWAPHAESTIHNLGEHPLLHLTGTYRNSISLHHTRTRTWVGLNYNISGGTRNKSGRLSAGHSRATSSNKSNLTLNQIAIILEFGSKDGRIPARPLWRPAWKVMGGNKGFQMAITKELRKEIRKYI